MIEDAEEHGAAVLGVPMKATVKVSVFACCCWRRRWCVSLVTYTVG